MVEVQYKRDINLELVTSLKFSRKHVGFLTIGSIKTFYGKKIYVGHRVYSSHGVVKYLS